MSERFWLKNYPAGVPADIDPSQFSSVVDLFQQSVAKFSQRDAYDFMGKRLTFAQLDSYSAQLASYWQAQGLQKGTRVALMMPNCLQYPIALFSVLRAGCVVVNINPLYTPRELQQQLIDSGAEAIVVLENFASHVQEVITHTQLKHVVVTGLGDLLGFPKSTLVNFVLRHVKKMVPAWQVPQAVSFHEALAQGEKHAFTPPTIAPDDLAFLQYTGGTTGVSKGAMLLHRNIVANVLQSEAWYQPALNKVPAGEQLIKVTALPLYHVFALTVCCLLGLKVGAMNLLIANPRDLPTFIKTLAKNPPHVLPAVNTLFNALLHHPSFSKVNWKKLILAVGGGMAVQAPVAAQWLERTGCPICEGYGLSETSPTALCNPTDTHNYSGTIGLPLPSTDVSIRDDAGQAVPLGEVGEICLRGPQLMAGYWQRPEETASVMLPDGFFCTGDLGFMDSRGYVKIVDRKKDIIMVSGFKAYPNEIEEVLVSHPGVLEAAAVGVPDEHSGEAVKVFVVKKDPNLTEAELRDFCAHNLTGYKKPKYIEFRSELPKTNVGKILRRKLRELV